MQILLSLLLLVALAGSASAQQRYALINPQGAIDRFATNIDPAAPTKSGWKWLPATPGAVPSYDPATQVLSGPVRMVGADAVTETYSVRAKTAGELDAEKYSEVDGIGVAVFRTLCDHENRIRVLESKAQITLAQCREGLKARIP